MAHKYKKEKFFVVVEHFEEEGGNPHSHEVTVVKKGILVDKVMETYLVSKRNERPNDFTLNEALALAEEEAKGYNRYAQ